MKKLFLILSILSISVGLHAAAHEQVFFGNGLNHINYIKGRNLNCKSIHAEYNKNNGTYKAFISIPGAGWQEKRGRAAQATYNQLKKEYAAQQ